MFLSGEWAILEEATKNAGCERHILQSLLVLEAED